MGSISIEHATFAYRDAVDARGASKKAPQVLHGLDLQIPNGQFLCVIGPSGSGKSTLLRLLMGLSLPDAGQVSIDGSRVEGPGLNRSFVFQDYSLFPWMKVSENVEFGIEQASKELGRGLDKAAIASIAQDYLERVDMADASDKYPYQLSGGMRQRVAIARALAMDTDILLFDEPFGALDIRTRRTLQGLVEELWRSAAVRKTVVFVTHDIAEALLLADRVVFLSKGSILADIAIDAARPRTPASLLEDPLLRNLNDRLTALFYSEGGLDEQGDASDMQDHASFFGAER